MNLRTVDLNLLVALDALLKTRHITRAGQRLGIGQPAMSAALARLRDTFQDELFVKQGSGMQPTPRALALGEELAPILRDVDRLFADRGEAFDPAASRRTFAVRLSDLMSAVLLPPLMASLQAEAPNVALDVRAMGPEHIVDALERDTLDLAVSMPIDVPTTIQSADLFEDRMVVLYRAGHPAAADMDGPLAQYRHRRIEVSGKPADPAADAKTARQQAKLKAQATGSVVTVRQWLAVPDILRATDCVAEVPESLARKLAAGGDLAMTPGGSPFTWAMYWHRRYDAEPGTAWLRDRLSDAAGD